MKLSRFTRSKAWPITPSKMRFQFAAPGCRVSARRRACSDCHLDPPNARVRRTIRNTVKPTPKEPIRRNISSNIHSYDSLNDHHRHYIQQYDKKQNDIANEIRKQQFHAARLDEIKDDSDGERHQGHQLG